MNRIKFRIWNKVAKSYCNEYKYCGVINELTQDNDETWEQSTGHTDKNGKTIFEGDIIRGMHDFGPAGFAERIMTVYFNQIEGGYGWNYWDMKTVEIIGTINDNVI